MNKQNNQDTNTGTTENSNSDNNDTENTEIANENNNDNRGTLEIIADTMDDVLASPFQNKRGGLIPRNMKDLFEWVEVFATALTIVIILFTFAVRMVTVEGPSMQQTLQANDNLVISQLFFTPRQNDIVVIQVPNPAFHAPIIKRVIATEGQQVDFDFHNWVVYVDGVALDEPYVNRVLGQSMRSDSILLEHLPITVEPGKIFVLGDNRNSSSDSRSASIGQVDVRNVVGRVVFRVFPLPSFGRVG